MPSSSKSITEHGRDMGMRRSRGGLGEKGTTIEKDTSHTLTQHTLGVCLGLLEDGDHECRCCN